MCELYKFLYKIYNKTYRIISIFAGAFINQIKTNMKKLPIYLMLSIVTLTIIPSTLFATEKNPIEIVSEPKEVPAEVKVMLTRLEEIKKIDKSTMNRLEKKALRKEVRSINASLRASNHGVYLSVGAIIIIVLLLIILL
jgi:hypothetical protein